MCVLLYYMDCVLSLKRDSLAEWVNINVNKVIKRSAGVPHCLYIIIIYMYHNIAYYTITFVPLITIMLYVGIYMHVAFVQISCICILRCNIRIVIIIRIIVRYVCVCIYMYVIYIIIYRRR